MFDDGSSLPDDHPTPVVASTPSSRPNQKRSKNFSEKEDSLIVSAWLNISMDPVYGTNQTRGTFWKRVYDFYHKHEDFPSERSQSSISHRWAHIQENVNKFCGCQSRIEDRRQSGVTFQDKLDQALALFKREDNENKSFQFMHCWNELRNQPKWQEKRRRIDAIKQAPNKKSKVNKNSNLGTATTINPDSSQNDTLRMRVLRKMPPRDQLVRTRPKKHCGEGCKVMLVRRLQNIFWGKKGV
ncbi:hypothetical protein BS78_08G155000 [Paspalum vaginatum]|nr:hypothetical protein BS78_08G155000 [Paspalum vaginatum]